MEPTDLAALDKAATPAPWQQNGSHFYGPDPDRELIGQMLGRQPSSDWDLIWYLRNNVPAILAQAGEIAKLREALEGLVTAVCFADPPKLFNGVLCHEARVPVGFIDIARAALAEQGDGM